MGRRVDWFFGRGLSIGCGLTWDVPAAWDWLPRNEQIDRIKETIRHKMSEPHIETSDIRRFLDLLSSSTKELWQHQFYTTNWDYLLQSQILSMRYQTKPRWLANSHVYHLNGTAETLTTNRNRSDFILAKDNVNVRTSTCETRNAYDRIVWNTKFIVVGMRFECEVDKFILRSLNRVEDDLPIGNSHWIIVDPDSVTLCNIRYRIKKALPRSDVKVVPYKFDYWLLRGLPELKDWGVIS